MTHRKPSPISSQRCGPGPIRHMVRYGHLFQPAIIDGPGAYMTTTDGRRLLDFASGQMSAILGHSHPEITQ